MTPDAVSTSGIAALAGLALGWTAKILVAYFQSKIWGPEKIKRDDKPDCVSLEECRRTHMTLDARLNASDQYDIRVDARLDLIIKGISDMQSAMSFLNGKLDRKKQ